MKKLLMLSLLCTAMAAPAFANDAQDAADDVKADVGAIHKDNAAIGHNQAEIEKHRAAKAAAKANGDVVDQAGHSLAIGTHQAAIGEKKAERNVDKKILKHHKKELNESVNEETNKE